MDQGYWHDLTEMTIKLKQLPTPTTEKILHGWLKNVGNGVPGTTWKKKEKKRKRVLLIYVPLITSRHSCNSNESLSGLCPRHRVSPPPTQPLSPSPTTKKNFSRSSKSGGNKVPGTTWKKKEEKRKRGLLLYVSLITGKQS